MATTAETKPRLTNAKRAANARSEARKPDGRFSAGGSGSFEGTGAILAAGAAGLAVGLAANIARKFAVQAPTLLSGDWDQALTNEHQLTLKVFDAIEATGESSTTKRATLLMNLKHMLSKHALEEENVIYPALRDAGMIAEADGLNKDHGYVKQYLYDLTEMPKDSPSWIAKVRAFRTDIEKHMREEEETLFPALKAKLDADKNKELTGQMNKEGLKLA
ncbi:hemerythrin domain-containing protein [Sphingomonas nostoxanthinifaciens]|uniref:hemerythrin domain-containing protein n=1 Tax=Sphingomonas nostoxanthinifaciens TaxID=2872652 RepID=UPI001CC1F4CA|nr:hemerythrin domain-containing protein [Sphingomonas nostoxanthinifaciens]UAK25411.1 hemerythrin domain-containing protein [Sphingomonas nostoxanthinifaciens]